MTNNCAFSIADHDMNETMIFIAFYQYAMEQIYFL